MPRIVLILVLNFQILEYVQILQAQCNCKYYNLREEIEQVDNIFLGQAVSKRINDSIFWDASSIEYDIRGIQNKFRS